MVAYDGINNTGNGHDANAKVWKDLSGNGNDGTLNGDATWQDNCLNFDGIDDWVSIGEMNYDNVTLETVVLNKKMRDSEVDYMCNYESGGYGLIYNPANNKENKNIFYIYTGNAYQSTKSSDSILIDKKYCLSGSYNGNEAKLFENCKKFSNNITGNIEPPKANNYFVLGGNPRVNNSSTEVSFTGEIYSLRIYNRGLTDEEILHNQRIDMEKYGVVIEEGE